jgi:TonB-linked SusC/RagA family outer membrane protein
MTFAQRTVTGSITDVNGESLIGANVLAKGTSVGTITDLDGNFSLEVPDGKNTLVISYTGYRTQEVDIKGQSNVQITMAEGELLDEIVVTGLGIKKEKKALGYAVTTIGASDIQLKPEADVARVLRGKVPGVDISQTSGLAGSGTNVIIRGYSSITGTNQPLFVVDGVPFNSDTNTDRDFTRGGATASSRFLDLDPNNIAEVSVLKGLSATVLYGEAGRNGVVLVTTKNGGTGDIDKKMSVTVDQSIFVTEAASTPELQNSWGNGFHNFASGAFSNWGANFNERTANDGVADDGTIAHPYSRANLNAVFPEYKDARYAYKAYDNLSQFFERGLTSATSVSMANRLSDGTSVNFNYGYRNEDGFVPLSSYTKHNFGLGTSTEFGNGFKLNATFNYITSDKVSPPTAPSFSSNPEGNGADGASLFSNVLYTPRSVDLYGLEFENPTTKESIYYRSGNDITNPRWTLKNAFDEETVNRFFTTASISKQIMEGLSLTYRLGLDKYTTASQFGVNKGGGQIPVGGLFDRNRSNSIINHDVLASVNKILTEDISFDLVAGVNVRSDRRETIGTASTEQLVYGNFQHDNYVNATAFSYEEDENLIGALASATFGYKNYLYLNLQGRNDWTSTLEADNRSVFYPSASVSFVATDAFDALANNSTINYLKFRLGYGTSAGYPNPYQTRGTLASNTRVTTNAGGTVINTNSVDNRIGNPNLKPELHKELEFGVEGQFWNNRIGLDLSLYNKNSSDLIIDLDLDPSTGFTSTTVNVAEIRNRGIELGLNFTPVRTNDFTWRLSANYTKNQSLIRKLADGIDQFAFAGYSNLGNFAISPIEITGDIDPADYPGGVVEGNTIYFPYGIIQGTRMLRNENGDLIVSSSGQYQSDPNLGILGDPNPVYTLNGGTEITFKGITLNALLSYSDGGVIYATTPSTLMGRGVLAETDFDRYVPVIAPGVIANADGTYRPNDIQITSTQHYWTNGGVFQDEMRTYDATYVKLREVSLSFALPKNWLSGTPFGSAQVQLSGQNLWFKAYGFPKGANFDNEVLSLGVGNGRGFELMNVPTARQYGGSIRFSF